MKKIILIIAAVVLVALFFGCAPKEGPHFGFARPEFRKVPPEIMAKIVNAGDAFTYPDANSIVIENVDSTVYNEDGTQTQYSYSLDKPLTPQGLKDESVINLSYDSQMMTVDILYAGVIHPDSTIEFVPDSEIIDQVASEGEMDIYWTNLRKKTLHFPKLYPGDAVVLAYKYTMLKPYFDGVIYGMAGFQSSEPIHTNRSVNLIPKSKMDKVHYKVLNDKNHWIKFREYDWKDYNVLVWEADSTPSFVPEFGMPSPTKFVPLVMFSNVTWKELSRKAWDVTEPPMKITNPEIPKMIKSLVETCKTEMDSIKAIALWVAQDVRYIGLSLGDKEGITPHDVNETFDARSGVCKDKAALAVAMLREAGFDAYNVLTNPMGYIIYDVAVNQFNHQIAMVRTRDGKEHFFDETVDLADTLPGYYSKKGYLVLSEEGEDLKYFPLIGPDINKGDVVARSRIDDAGNLTSTVVITGHGVYDMVIRQIRQMLEDEDRERLFRRLINQIDPNAKLIDLKFEPDSPTDLTESAKITVKYEIPDFAIDAGNYLLLSAPCAQHTFDILSSSISEYTKLEDRKYPIEFQFAMGCDITETIQLPAEYKPKSIPDNVDLNNKYLKYSMNYDIRGKVVTYKSSLRLTDIEVPLKDYPAFRKAYTDYQNSEKGMLFLNR